MWNNHDTISHQTATTFSTSIATLSTTQPMLLSNKNNVSANNSAVLLELSVLVGNFLPTSTYHQQQNSAAEQPLSLGLTALDDDDLCAIDIDQENKPLTDNLTRVIYTVLVPAVCLIGSIGASISLFIFTRKQMRSSLNAYLAALSFFDLILLGMCMLIYPSMNLCLQEGHTGIVCHFFWNSSLATYPISLMAQMGSVWTCVAITVDRFLAVQYPFHHMRAWCTPSHAKTIIFFIGVVTILYKMPSFFELSLDECGRLRTTDLRKHPLYIVIYNTYGKTKLSLIQKQIPTTLGYLLLLLVIPFLVIIILNIFVIFAVRRAKSQRERMQMVMRRTGSINIDGSNSHRTARKTSRWSSMGTTIISANDSISLAGAMNGHVNGSGGGHLGSLNGHVGHHHFHHRSAQTSVSQPFIGATAEIDNRCTKMATITITAFLIFNSLAGMNNVIEAFELSFPFETYRIPIGNLLVCVNSATNIFIYSIFGRKFRKMMFAELLCPCICWPFGWTKKSYDSLVRTINSSRATV